MKKFQPIYYASLALLAVLIMVFSAINFNGTKVGKSIDIASAKGHIKNITALASARDSFYNPDAIDATVDYLTDDVLSKEYGIKKVVSTENDDGNIVINALVDEISYTVVETVATSDDINNWYAKIGKTDSYYVSTDTKFIHVAVYIPAQGETAAEMNSDTILYLTTFDSDAFTQGASKLAGTSAMLESIKALKDNKDNKNSYLFVFADGGQQDGLGVYSFTQRFLGYNKVMSRVKAAITLDAYGSEGTLALYSASDNASKLASVWAGANKGVYSSTLINTFESKSYFNKALVGIPALNFANIGGSYNENMISDKAENVSDKLISQMGSTVLKTANKLASYDLDKLSKGTKSVNFSYLGEVIAYNDLASYILASAALVLAGVVAVFAIMKKSFTLASLLKGALVAIISLLVAIVLNYAFYYAIGSLLAVMGVFNIHALSTISYSSIGLVIAAAIISTVFSTGAIIALKRILKAKAIDVVRGNILVTTLAAIVLGYALPKFAYIFIFLAILELIAVLVVILLKDKFKAKFGKDIDRLLPYSIPVILTLPITFGAVLTISALAGAVFYPLIMGIVVAVLAHITPYFDYLKKPLDAIAKKLPERTVRVLRVGEKDVEDPVKKGKFEKKIVKETVKVKVAREYKNSFGLSTIAVIGLILVIVFSLITPNYQYNKTNAYTTDYSEKTSVVFYKFGSENYWIIKDLDLYNKIDLELEGYEWNDDLGGYAKKVSMSSKAQGTPDFSKGNSLTAIDSINPTITDTKKTFNIRFGTTLPASSKFSYSVTLNNVNNISQVYISTVDHKGAKVEQTIEVNSTKGTLVIPNLRGASTIAVTGKSSVYSGKLVIEAEISSYQDNNLLTHFNSFEEWSRIINVAADKNIDKINLTTKIRVEQNI